MTDKISKYAKFLNYRCVEHHKRRKDRYWLIIDIINANSLQFVAGSLNWNDSAEGCKMVHVIRTLSVNNYQSAL